MRGGKINGNMGIPLHSMDRNFNRNSILPSLLSMENDTDRKGGDPTEHMKPVYIELVNLGVANRYEYPEFEVIEMNWRLAQYPDLWAEIMKHEVGHSPGKFTLHDFMHDMKSKTKGLYGFMANHISSWTQLLPLYFDRKKGQVIYDISSSFTWVLGIGIATGTYYVLRGIL